LEDGQKEVDPPVVATPFDHNFEQISEILKRAEIGVLPAAHLHNHEVVVTDCSVDDILEKARIVSINVALLVENVDEGRSERLTVPDGPGEQRRNLEKHLADIVAEVSASAQKARDNLREVVPEKSFCVLIIGRRELVVVQDLVNKQAELPSVFVGTEM
jgi:hypothetical protein